MSSFNIQNISIANALIDGLDIDFSEGVISEGSFSNIGKSMGGDAIDFSGSESKISNISIFNVDDKGLSIGEKSNIYANNISISKVSIGVAVKDGSLLDMENADISYSDNGILAYIKKNEYSPAKANLKNINFQSTKLNFRAEASSKIFLDGILVGKESLASD